MSWIGGSFVVEDINKKTLDSVYSRIRRAVRSNANLEEFPNMGKNIMKVKQLTSEVFPSYESAEEYVNRFSNWQRKYNVYVQFHTTDDLKPTAKITNAKRMITETQQKKEKYLKEHSVNTFKSEYVGCSECGSKIAKTYVYNNICPACRHSMLSETTKKTLKGYDDKVKKLKALIRVENEKRTEKAKINYLVAYEEYIG